MTKIIKNSKGMLSYSIIDLNKHKLSVPEFIEHFKGKYSKVVYLELLECSERHKGYGSDLVTQLKRKTSYPIIVQAGFISMEDLLNCHSTRERQQFLNGLVYFYESNGFTDVSDQFSSYKCSRILICDRFPV